MNRRLRAGGIHLLISAVVAAAAALVIFLVWFPAPLATVAGGITLFSLLVGVDVVVGPALTALVASPSKPVLELRRDIAVIAVLQAAAFGYGVYSIALARPVYLAFEVDRIQVVTAADIDPQSLGQAPEGMRHLSWFGPRLIATRRSTDLAEIMRSMELAMQGMDLAKQPDRWTEYASQRDAILKASSSSRTVLDRAPEMAGRLEALAQQSGTVPSELRALPIFGRGGSAMAIISPKDAHVVGYLAIPAP